MFGKIISNLNQYLILEVQKAPLCFKSYAMKRFDLCRFHFPPEIWVKVSSLTNGKLNCLLVVDAVGQHFRCGSIDKAPTFGDEWCGCRPWCDRAPSEVNVTRRFDNAAPFERVSTFLSTAHCFVRWAFNRIRQSPTSERVVLCVPLTSAGAPLTATRRPVGRRRWTI